MEILVRRLYLREGDGHTQSLVGDLLQRGIPAERILKYGLPLKGGDA